MEIVKSVLVPYAAESMFDLIEGAEHYPAFVPGCVAASILERTEEIVAARLTMRISGVALHIETRNRKARPEWMEIAMVSGPFRRFQGSWRLTPLNAAGCRIAFTLSYELEGAAARLIGPMFGRMADHLIDAFVLRAERVLPLAGGGLIEAMAPAPPSIVNGSNDDR
jgi:ribosome-associated toxin RatA of RatAB toxin-antitoxin module